MSHKLSGRKVDDILVMWLGPHNDRNYFATAAPRLLTILRGTGEVTIEETAVFNIRGTNNSNAIGSQPIRGGKLMASSDPTDWTPLGTVDQASSTPGPQVLSPTASPTIIAIRARVSVIGDGAIEIVSDWN